MSTINEPFIDHHLSDMGITDPVAVDLAPRTLRVTCLDCGVSDETAAMLEISLTAQRGDGRDLPAKEPLTTLKVLAEPAVVWLPRHLLDASPGACNPPKAVPHDNIKIRLVGDTSNPKFSAVYAAAHLRWNAAVEGWRALPDGYGHYIAEKVYPNPYRREGQTE